MARPANTALLMVDFINFFNFESAGSLAPRAVRAARATARLKARARKVRMPCIYANDNFGHWTSEFSQLTRECARRGGPGADIVRILEPQRGDFSVLKPRHSAFYGTPLEFLLEELKVDKIIVTGIALDMCVFATAQDAYVRKFSVWVPSDCVASFSHERERAALTHMALVLKAYTMSAQRHPSLTWRVKK